MVQSPFRVEPGKKVDLSRWPTGETAPFKDKDQAKPAIKKNLQRLIELQELLYASGTHSVLIVLQAMDAGGKDGAIDHVFSGVNPQGCNVTSFKVPSHLELAHDYLWRYHLACPRKGMMEIFNRSHYESVLVERVHKIVPKEVWSRRYQQINDFERMLTQENTLILKFFLHISKAEQRRRLEARLEDKTKHWKFNPLDVAERKRWDDYTEAFEDALRYCSTEESPWYVVPSDHKWFRNWVLSDTIARALEKLNLKLPPTPPGLDEVKIH
ncbi:MAG: polyphosphate kinase 2 family protein [Tepidisphaeraceae bacterium]|jgi:PPK2 family polyphosphate:nucleotide phosphotransferase